MALVMPSPTPTTPLPASSPGSPVPFSRPSRSSGLAPPPSPYPQHVDPSPTDSNGTESTEIDEDEQESGLQDDTTSATSNGSEKPTALESLARITTDLPTAASRSRASSDEDPQSVIHAPPDFLDYKNVAHSRSPHESSEKGQPGIGSPVTPDAAIGPDDKRMSLSSPLNTNLPPSESLDRPTPRAQTRQEAEENTRGPRASSQLKNIPESCDAQTVLEGEHRNLADSPHQSIQTSSKTNIEAAPLQTALGECWTLCNTLATLSSNHRNHMFTSTSGGAQECAWQSCWRLCQMLYECYDQPTSEALPILELCRDFSQALFEVRQRGDEATDSVLRVSFEMNNHLYNTHDRHLPEAFRERTLDFYITMCHRMMKQRTALTHETDALLRACWSLAEMLFNLRLACRESKTPDDELLGSAVQACWELCDLFREGWAQVRPDRGTPRPGQLSFAQNVRGSNSSIHSAVRPASSLSSSSYHDAPSLLPETPITIFDDATTASSPDSAKVPNILVLGPCNTNTLGRGTQHDRWSSNASTLSGYSESASSKRTSSTATASTEGSHMLRLQYLILKVAINAGFSRASAQPFPSFVRSLPADAFGPLSWQKQLLGQYKGLVDADVSLRGINNLPSKRLTAREVAKAVVWLARDEKWAWMRELYRLACDVSIDEAVARGTNRYMQV